MSLVLEIIYRIYEDKPHPKICAEKGKMITQEKIERRTGQRKLPSFFFFFHLAHGNDHTITSDRATFDRLDPKGTCSREVSLQIIIYVRKFTIERCSAYRVTT
jgi:hypothetical protein